MNKLIAAVIGGGLILLLSTLAEAGQLEFSYPLPTLAGEPDQIMADGKGGVAFHYVLSNGPTPAENVDTIVWLDAHGGQIYVDTLAQSDGQSIIVTVSDKGLVILHALGLSTGTPHGEARVIDNHGQLTFVAMQVCATANCNDFATIVTPPQVFGDGKRFFLWHEDINGQNKSLVAYSYP